MKTITITELRKVNPYLAGKVLTALNRNRVNTKTRKKQQKFSMYPYQEHQLITLKIHK